MPEITWTVPSGHQAITATAETVDNAATLTTVREVGSGATGTATAETSLSVALGSLAMSMVIRAASDLPPSPDPTPDPPDPSEDWKYAQVGDSPQLAIAAINPTSTAYPGGRGPDQLILYRDPETITETNEWGTEVQVGSDDIIDAVNDRQASGSGTGTSIPSGGYVLSGHGTARQFLNTWATVGATVTLSTEADPNPTPGGGGGGGTTPTSGYPVRAVAVYKKVWSNNTAITNVPSSANDIRISFAQGSPPALTGYTSTGQSSMVASLATRRAAGASIIVSIGGAGGGINTGARTTFVAGIATIKGILEGSAGGGMDGIDWDIEASSLNQADVVWISTYLKQTYGSDFAITMAPNGGNVSQYLPAAVALYRAGALDHYGQQFYDSPVSLAAARGRIAEALGAGLPQSVMGVGMMTTSSGAGDANHWSLAQCRTYMADIRATWPGITKCYLWMEDDQASSAATWVSDMRRIVGL